jgi:hypothetical protein
MGPSMCSLVSPNKENSVVFNIRESEKNLKATLGLSFFVILVSEVRKRDKLLLKRCPFEPFNECERKQDHSTIFSCLERLKRA